MKLNKIDSNHFKIKVKRDETFSLIFFLPETVYMELELRSGGVQGAHWPSFFRQKFLLIPKSASVDFQDILRTFLFYT